MGVVRDFNGNAELALPLEFSVTLPSVIMQIAICGNIHLDAGAARIAKAAVAFQPVP